MPPIKETGSVQAAVWTTAYVDSLPNSSFAYVSDDGKTRKLPYKDKNGKVDLPHVRNALARLDQTQGIPDDEKSAIRTKLQNALKSTKAADDMVLRSVHSIQASQSSDGQNELPQRVMLLRSGIFHTQKYGDVPLEASDLNEMKQNFDNGVGMPDDGATGIPVDYAHQSHLNAAFWIKGMEVEAEDDGGAILWGTNLEFSDSGRQALLGKEYKCLSSDFYPRAFGEWVDSESGVVAQNVIVGAALTNRPMFSGNKVVRASEIEAAAEEEAEATGVKTVIYVNASETIKERRMNLDQLRVKAAEDLNGAEYKFVVEHESELSADERSKFGLKAAAPIEEPKKEEPKVEAAVVTQPADGAVSVQASELKAIQDTIATLAAERTADKETISGLQASITKLEEKNTSLEASSQQSTEKEMRTIVEAAAARGAIKADRVDSYTNRLVAAQGEERDALIADLQALADNPLLAGAYGSSKTEGTAAMDVEESILKKANELVQAAHAKGDKLNIFQARQQVLASDPELAVRSTSAVQAAAPNFDPFSGTSWGVNAKGLQGVNPEVAKK